MEKPITNTDSRPAEQPRRVPMWVVVLAFLALVGFMALIGWGLNRAMRGSIVVGDQVPAFTLTTFDGESITSTDFTGKVVVLNFWASWCKPCEQEARELEQAFQYFQVEDEVVFLGLAYVDTEPNAEAYLERFGITYPNGPDLATKVSQMFRVRGVPETFIIDRSGKLAYFKAGPFTSLEEIVSVVDGVLSK